MIRRIFVIFGAALLLAWPSVALAAGFPAGPRGYCTFNADKSSVIVRASNAGTKSYACLVTCKLNVAGQRAFDPFECRFSLGANTAEKTVCTHKGNGPGHFTKINSGNFLCSPR